LHQVRNEIDEGRESLQRGRILDGKRSAVSWLAWTSQETYPTLLQWERSEDRALARHPTPSCARLAMLLMAKDFA